MKVALATQLEVSPFARDDDHYVNALQEQGASVHLMPWDDERIDWSSFDAVQIRSTWNYVEQLDAFLSWCERVERTTPLHNPRPLLQWNATKAYLRELESAGIAIVPTRWIAPREPVNITNELAGWRAQMGFLKPTVGANASGTLRFTLDDDGRVSQAVEDHLAHLQQRGECMLQPYLSSVEARGELSLIYFDGRFSHGVRKIPRCGDFRVQDDHGASDFPEFPSHSAREIADRCIDHVSALPFVGLPPLYARVDLMQGDEGQYLVGEVEMIEPSLFFRHDRQAASNLAGALLARI
jgi:hypothetical protein